MQKEARKVKVHSTHRTGHCKSRETAELEASSGPEFQDHHFSISFQMWLAGRRSAQASPV